MSQMYGTVDVSWGDTWWSSVVLVESLILPSADLNGCLFGVTNYSGLVPLFADRGIPPDANVFDREDSKYFTMPDSHPSWVLWRELAQVDWTERATERDFRISEYSVDDGGRETPLGKWLQKAGMDWVRQALDEEPSREVRDRTSVYRKEYVTRNDAIDGTEFPLILKLMACLATRFGDSNVRLFVWFD